MRPANLKTRIFLDSGDPQETKEALRLLGFLDGQTTNPTLVSKHPLARERFARGEKFSHRELLHFYQRVVREIVRSIPQGSISIEVYTEARTLASQMFKEAREFSGWTRYAQIKLPVSREGLRAARQAIKEGLKVNMTLCFSQEQAAAVYAATTGAQEDEVFLSPFVGRLDDQGESGMDLVANIIKMYKQGEGQVKVLTASVRNLDHLLSTFAFGRGYCDCPS